MSWEKIGDRLEENTETPRRNVLKMGAAALGSAVAGCAGKGRENVTDTETSIPTGTPTETEDTKTDTSTDTPDPAPGSEERIREIAGYLLPADVIGYDDDYSFSLRDTKTHRSLLTQDEIDFQSRGYRLERSGAFDWEHSLAELSLGDDRIVKWDEEKTSRDEIIKDLEEIGCTRETVKNGSPIYTGKNLITPDASWSEEVPAAAGLHQGHLIVAEESEITEVTPQEQVKQYIETKENQNGYVHQGAISNAFGEESPLIHPDMIEIIAERMESKDWIDREIRGIRDDEINQILQMRPSDNGCVDAYILTHVPSELATADRSGIVDTEHIGSYNTNLYDNIPRTSGRQTYDDEVAECQI